MLDPNSQNAGGEEPKKTISDAFLLRKREVIAYYEELLKIALQSNTPTKLMTIAEFAEYLSISQDTARELIKTNKIPYYALSERGFRISVTALNTFLAAKKSNKIAVTSEIDGSKSFTAIRDARVNQKAQRQAQQPQKPSNTSTKPQQEQQKKSQEQVKNQQKNKPNNQQNNSQNKPQQSQNQTKPKLQKQQQIGENQRKNSIIEAEKEKKDDFVMIYPAELNKNKNQTLLLHVLHEINKEDKSVHLLLAGKDNLNGYHKKLADDLGVAKNVHFLGYRSDIPQLLQMSDLSVSASHREGLPVHLIEAMFAGLPIVTTRCRGATELVEDGVNGFVVGFDQQEFLQKIEKIRRNPSLSRQLSKQSIKLASQYDIKSILSMAEKVYHE